MYGKIYLSQTHDTKTCVFTLNVHGVELSFEVNARGKIFIAHIDALAEQDKLIFERVIQLATNIEQAANPQAGISYLQAELAKKSLGFKSHKKLTGLSSKGENPFDYYYVSSPSVLPKIFADTVPSINMFMLFLASLFLIPGVIDSSDNVLIAIAFSALAMIVQLFSTMLDQRIGVNNNRFIQDVFSGTVLSVNSFSSIRTLARIFIDRALVLNNNEQSIEANFIAGMVVIVIAAIGAGASWFMPSIAVMGPRIQATAVNIERMVLADSTNNTSSKEKLIESFKRNERVSLAQRFCPMPRKKIATGDYDERVINPPTILGAGKCLGSAFIRAVQFSLAVGINSGVFESVLVPLAFISLLHAFVNREFTVKAGRKNLFKVPALSDQSANLAKTIKWISELAAVSYNSLINPAIAFFFVGDKILQAFNVNKEHGAFGAINASLLAAALLLTVPSLILDLKSRDLGVDRFEGWSALRLSYILDAAKNQLMRQNLAGYLELLITCAQLDIKPMEDRSEPNAMAFFNRPKSSVSKLGLTHAA